MSNLVLSKHVRPALVTLQEMLHQFWPRKENLFESIPLEFWKIADDEIFFDALQYLPCCMSCHGGSSGHGHTEEEIAQLPQGWKIALAIFELEDEFTTEGWTAIPNIGAEGLTRAIEAYEIVGLFLRVNALQRVLVQYRQEPENEEAFRIAANGDLPDLLDGDSSLNAVISFLRCDSGVLFGTLC